MLDFANSTLGYENLILFNFYQVWYREKVDNLQKFRSRRNKIFVGILFFLVFSKSGIQYLWQGEISVCKVLVPIKVVQVKNDYFLHPKFELQRYHQMNGFLYWIRFYWKKIGTYISHEIIARPIPTWIWYDLLTVGQIWPSNHQLSYFCRFKVAQQLESITLQNLVLM